jgi:hypothetical protein
MPFHYRLAWVDLGNAIGKVFSFQALIQGRHRSLDSEPADARLLSPLGSEFA